LSPYELLRDERLRQSELQALCVGTDHTGRADETQALGPEEMSTPLILTAVKRGDRFEFTAPALYRRYVAHIGEGEERQVVLRAMPKRQGTQAMRYYRGVVVPDIANASGVDDPDDYGSVHEALAWKFLKIADHPQFGYPRRQSTAKDEMTQDEMTAYIDKCITWAETSIPGCRVRRPEEIEWDTVPDHGWAA
jgi:hypothetical protein